MAEPGKRLSVVRNDVSFVAPHALVSPVIYLNRCVGGCLLQPGNDDDATSTNPTSGIVAQQSNLGEFMFSQTVWNEIVQCVKEVYSPFNVQVTETRPGAGTQYHHAIVAGTAEQAGLPAGVLGIAIVRGDCAPRNNAVSLTLANSHPNNAGTALEMCWTVAQESAHAFGLDHSFMFTSGNSPTPNQSACNDALTYRRDCGGQKFFRNDAATCGENKVKPCNCGTTQNSHGKLLVAFGANEGTQIIPPPSSTITMPTTGQLGANVMVSAGSKRGVSKIELVINGFKWGEIKGATFGPNGQANPSTYSIPIPPALPNSIVDVIARSCDDLGRCSDSPTVTLTKGAACADASTCAKGQKCEAGKCFWDPPVGQVGDPCTYNEFCEGLMCAGDEGAQVCSKNCLPNSVGSCPMDFECIPTGTTAGFCYPKEEGGGCCSVGDDSGPSRWFVHGGLSLAMLGLLLRRRRRPARK
ncbi:MAG: MYXO-CTERM sorting domain-containing protein [Myxococcota bacterium]|nr:MYXO-CTERM sorting domain-containing protein [Myxococcota bacterium]